MFALEVVLRHKNPYLRAKWAMDAQALARANEGLGPSKGGLRTMSQERHFRKPFRTRHRSQ
jgi:hypothetical protein